MTCQHEEFDAQVEVNRITTSDEAYSPVYWYDVCVTLRCVQCDMDFRLVDPEIPMGALAGRVTVNPFGTEVRLPMWPNDGTEPPKGNLAGFTIERTL